MPLLPLIILVAGAGTVSVILDRRLRAKKQAEAAAATETEESSENAPGGLEQLFAAPMQWYRSMFNKQPEDFPQRFREWAVNTSDDAQVKEWLNSLSDDGLKAYTKHLSGYCTDMGFELAWLVEKQLDHRDPNLAQTVQRIVIHYCKACQQAATCQEDLEIHKQLMSLEQNPGGRRNQTFGEQLLAKLVEANLVTTSSSEFIAASAKERQQLIADAINEASNKDQAVFSRLVREVVYNNHPATPPAGAAAGEASANSATGTESANPA